MRATLRATAILSSGTVVKIAAGLVVAKVWAVLVGPAGVGMLGLMQSLVGIVGIVAALGVGTGVVRIGASALGRGDAAAAAATVCATLWISRAAGAVAALLVVLAREPLGRALLDGPVGLADAAWLGAGVGLTVVTGAQLGILNAHQRVGALARAAVWGSLGAAVVGVGVLWVMRADGLAQAYVAGLAATTLASTWELARSGIAAAPLRVADVTAAARRLLRFGLPFTASALVGTGVTLALPVVVLQVLDVQAVGMYRAALTVSAGYLGFLLVAMGQDYYPRLAGARGEAVGQVVNDQLRLLLLVGTPVAICAQATAAWIVPVIYAPAFAPAVRVLEWQLTGELFRFWAWAFAFVLLARSSSAHYFATEAAGGALLLGATWAGVRAFGLPGSGVGFAGAYAGYAALVWALVRFRFGLSVALTSRLLMLAAVATSAALHLLSYMETGRPGQIAALGLAASFSLVCALMIRNDLRAKGGAPLFVAESAAETGRDGVATSSRPEETGAVVTGRPVVSVLVPVYNHEAFVEACLDSVASQDYDAVELVVIDDGSSDQSASRVEAWLAAHAARFHRVVFERQANQGLVPTANRLVALAQGEYTNLIASDDLLLPGALAKRVAVLDADPEALAVFTNCVEMRDGQTVQAALAPSYSAANSRMLARSRSLLTALLLLRFPVPGPGLMARRSVYDPVRGIGPYDEAVYPEDMDFYFRVARRGALRYLPECTAVYRAHATNSYAESSPKLYHGVRATLRRHAPDLKTYDRLLMELFYRCTLPPWRRPWLKRRPVEIASRLAMSGLWWVHAGFSMLPGRGRQTAHSRTAA